MGTYVTAGTSEVRSIALRWLDPATAGEAVAFVFVRLFLEGVWPATASAVRLLDERSASGWRFIFLMISSAGVTKAGTDVGLSASL